MARVPLRGSYVFTREAIDSEKAQPVHKPEALITDRSEPARVITPQPAVEGANARAEGC